MDGGSRVNSAPSTLARGVTLSSDPVDPFDTLDARLLAATPFPS